MRREEEEEGWGVQRKRRSFEIERTDKTLVLNLDNFVAFCFISIICLNVCVSIPVERPDAISL